MGAVHRGSVLLAASAHRPRIKDPLAYTIDRERKIDDFDAAYTIVHANRVRPAITRSSSCMQIVYTIVVVYANHMQKNGQKTVNLIPDFARICVDDDVRNHGHNRARTLMRSLRVEHAAIMEIRLD